MQLRKVPTVVGGVLVFAVIGTAAMLSGCSSKNNKSGSTSAAAPDSGRLVAPAAAVTVDLNDAQEKSVEISAIGERNFKQQRTAVGSIDFNENLSVQVFPPYQGKIIKAYVDIGDYVKKGQTLYTIDSPDLLAAESTLIAADGVYKLTTAALARAKELYETQGLAQKDYQQAISDQQTADAALKVARASVRIFGKTDAEINDMESRRRVDASLVVSAPISGRITARVAQPGLLVQPGNAPAPYSVADVSKVWLLANVAESDSPLFQVGQDVRATVMAYPGKTFEGKVTVIGATVDPNLHTELVRSEIDDPKHELRPGMFANFDIRVADPVASLAVPMNGIVREGDGTYTAWTTTDRHRFNKRTVKIGSQQDGYDQIVDGLKKGELIVSSGAIFLSNMLIAHPDD